MKIVGHRGAGGLAPENTIAGINKALEHGVYAIEFDLRVTQDGVVILHHNRHLTDPGGARHKISGTTNPIIKIIKKHLKSGWEEDNLRIASKSQKTLKELHSALPTLRAVVIEPWSGVRATWRARQIGTNHIIMNQRWLWWGFIRSISRNYKLGTYTLNDPKKAARWEKHGLRMVITDYPDRFH
jgi:glycerophosphoryl diester phosphodiesterase